MQVYHRGNRTRRYRIDRNILLVERCDDLNSMSGWRIVAAMNRLSAETSPYLLQHAENPVDWYPWGDEAFEQAIKHDRPILLSIGYSACHWCHVMAHESFEDADTAAEMNRLFVNIKVDREERPDLDKIYQTAHQLIAQRAGGWPLTMFLNPANQRPFFAGTYFPNEARHGMPSFEELMKQVVEVWHDHRNEIETHGEAIVEALTQLQPDDPEPGQVLDTSPLATAREVLGQQFDQVSGGFGSAPKFPHASNLELMLRHWRSTAHSDEPDTQAMLICALTLTRMAEGGIYDQIGGGFCRYSVDQFWTIPHFEKMLYDNGPLLALYAQLWQVSGDELYRRVAAETADWVLRDMRSPEGGFYSALDADSEGREGQFYTWTPAEASSLLADDEYRILAARLGLDRPPNFEGGWHLVVCQSIEDIAKSNGLNQSAVERLLNAGRAQLLEARNKRVWPGRDEKVLTSWNALMIRGLSIAARALDRDDMADAAAGAVDFLQHNLVRDDRLLATYKDGRARFNAYLDDYAYLLDAIIELLQTRWSNEHLGFAVWLADQLLNHFQDTERGGFYFTANDHEELVIRTKSLSDDALPSGNGVAALALNRLGHLLGETRYIDAAEGTLKSGWADMVKFPHGHTALLAALDEYIKTPEVVILRGEKNGIESWADSLNTLYTPRRLILAIPDTETDLPGALSARAPKESEVAYICRGTTCGAPINSVDELVAELNESPPQSVTEIQT